MPCNIGFKSYAKIEIPVPEPQVFSVKSEAPDIDAELLKKLGIEDPVFLKWAINDLDVKPLLQEALKRALAAVDTGGLYFTIDANGMLEAKGRFATPREKKLLSEKALAVSDRWQFEILGIVAEILNYSVTISQRGDEMKLEAEEAGKSHPCDYIKVTRRGGVSEITFEHFKSRTTLDLATAKFLALAHALGVKIALGNHEVSEGDPFPGEEMHSHRHGHHHGGHDNEH
ncbi:MAG: hypothetical protein UY70_C0002G0005 [Candidatus Kaiserbacteria bacterium GW2011_GWB1_52_6]|uniref:Uncharacterized protein n=3 Tax=Candidatus Kaiseribacteriota TaxID=1752734 RepID=A0A0G1XIM6_9BACT|nr:MAG: hypothetical protein UY67_C0002G0005 [Candidatus Kaiserbacteria bacterium GW2011_GWA2_52_12]KKW28131.1 MAG: hypothetical protein UY70_C0002G0005 [Candidatus Kaiserbacteria bacterium GW2011_GWB1_52_6]KKW30760.1 MAG: hypothetical protein UY74_C0032G0005 [Candidatus Kaiserbacteria bacterium GW2011_GWC2_52_8b]